MRSDATGSGDEQEYPFLGVAVLVLALYALLAGLVPPSPVRAVVAIAAFASMGYALLALIGGRHVRLTAAEILAFTVGLTILLTSLSALAVSLIGIPITEFAVVVIGLPIGVITWMVRRPRVHPWTAVQGFLGRFFDFSEYSDTERGVATILFASVLIVTGVLVSLALVEFPDVLTPAIAITGSDGTPDSLPSSFNVNQTVEIVVTIQGGESAGSYAVRIRLVPVNATGSEPFDDVAPTWPVRLDAFAQYSESVTLAARGFWTKPYSIEIVEAGLFHLVFELVDGSGATVAASRIPVSVS